MQPDDDIPTSPALRKALVRSSERLHMPVDLDAQIRGRIQDEWSGSRNLGSRNLGGGLAGGRFGRGWRIAASAAAAVLIFSVLVSQMWNPPVAGAGAGPDARHATLARAVDAGRSSSPAARQLLPVLLATLVADNSAFTPRTGGDIFTAFDIVIDASDAVDGLVFELSIPGSTGVFVGFESGDAPFADAPTYDAARMAAGQLRLATIAESPARGRVRIATVTLQSDEPIEALTIMPLSSVVTESGKVRAVQPNFTCVPRNAQ